MSGPDDVRRDLVSLFAQAVSRLDDGDAIDLFDRLQFMIRPPDGARAVAKHAVRAALSSNRDMRLRGDDGELSAPRMRRVAEILLLALDWSVGRSDRDGHQMALDMIIDRLVERDRGGGEDVQPSERVATIAAFVGSAVVGTACMMDSADQTVADALDAMRRGP